MRRLAAVLALAVTGCASGLAEAPAPEREQSACAGLVVAVWRDDPVPCDVRPPQRLDVYGVSFPACLDMGGVWIPGNPTKCRDVDY